MFKATFALLLVAAAVPAIADEWKSDPVWHDGLVEKATYSATRVVYGKPRSYDAIFLTNKEQHDTKTLTKADKSKDLIEVWKHNQIEDIPTPNYTYHYLTTSHLTVDKLELTRLDCSSQEFCGTSFKQFEVRPGQTTMRFFLFSYMPEAGRVDGTLELEKRTVIPADSLPLWLRDYDFDKKPAVRFWTIAGQKSNRQTDPSVVGGEVRYLGEDGGAHKLGFYKSDQLAATYWMAKDRLHVMTKYASADGQQQTYELKGLERVNYWTIKGE